MTSVIGVCENGAPASFIVAAPSASASPLNAFEKCPSTGVTFGPAFAANDPGVGGTGAPEVTGEFPDPPGSPAACGVADGTVFGSVGANVPGVSDSTTGAIIASVFSTGFCVGSTSSRFVPTVPVPGSSWDVLVCAWTVDVGEFSLVEFVAVQVVMVVTVVVPSSSTR